MGRRMNTISFTITLLVSSFLFTVFVCLFFTPSSKALAKTKFSFRRILLFYGENDYKRTVRDPRFAALYDNPHLTSNELAKLATWHDPWAKIRSAKDPKTPLETLTMLWGETSTQNIYIDLTRKFLLENTSVPELTRTLWSLSWTEGNN